MRTFFQANLRGFLLGCVHFPTIAQHASNHPERADANGGSAMNKRRTICGIVGNFKKLSSLFILRLTEDKRNVEVAQAQLFCLRFFLGRPMFAWLTQVDDGLHAFVF